MDDDTVLSVAACRLRAEVLPTDRDAVRAIVGATGFFNAEEVDVAVELVDERLAKGLDSGYQFLLAEVDDQPVAYACYGPIACTAASYDLYWIAVAPPWQRSGLGRRLLTNVERRVSAAGGERIYIDTSGKDLYAPTRRFYERCGYDVAARLDDFYAAGDDRLIYMKRLGCQR